MRKLFAYAPHYLREIYACGHRSGILSSAATFTLHGDGGPEQDRIPLRKSGETTVGPANLTSLQISRCAREE